MSTARKCCRYFVAAMLLCLAPVGAGALPGHTDHSTSSGVPVLPCKRPARVDSGPGDCSREGSSTQPPRKGGHDRRPPWQ
jgi:hypothetical protein